MSDRVARNLALAYDAAERVRTHVRDPGDMEDVRSAAVVGLMRAEERFDPARHSWGDRGWSSYAWKWARSFAQREVELLRSSVTRSFEGPSDGREVVPLDAGSPDWIDEMGSRKSPEGEVLDGLTSRTLVGILPAAQRGVVVRYYGLDGDGGRTTVELAEEEGVTKQAIHLRLKKALEKIRNAFSREDV